MKKFKRWLGALLFKLIQDDLEVFLWSHPQNLNHRLKADFVTWQLHRGLPGHLEVVYGAHGTRETKKISLACPKHLTNDDSIRAYLLAHPKSYL